MICSNCGYPNPNGYEGPCKSCRQPLIQDVVQEAIQTPKTVAKKTQVKKTTAKTSVRGIYGESK
jgi:hypothetical protein